ncbi:MAG: hypothetical protein ACK5MA_09110 [Parachlamydiaceae bacterium]
MITCCRRGVDEELLLQEEGRPRKSFWQGRAVQFYCWEGGKEEGGTAAVLYTVALAITVLASLALTYAVTNIPNAVLEDAFLMFPVGVWLFCSIPGAFTMDAVNRCRRPRKWPSPAITTAAALITATAYILINRGNAQGDLIRYYENQNSTNKLRENILNSCSKLVLESSEEMTSNACIVCNSEEQPFQSLLSGDVGVSISDCLAPLNGSTITISMNESVPGRDYLCGVSSTTDDETSWQTKDCVVDYLAENYCLYPPLIATYDNFYATVSATIHIDMLQRCKEDKERDACSSYYHNCDTPEAAEYFKEIRSLYKMVKNATLPYPEDADSYLKLTDPVAVPLTSTTVGVSAFAFLYEGIALRTYMLSAAPV